MFELKGYQFENLTHNLQQSTSSEIVYDFTDEQLLKLFGENQLRARIRHTSTMGMLQAGGSIGELIHAHLVVAQCEHVTDEIFRADFSLYMIE